MKKILVDALIFSLLFGGFITLIQLINPRLELHNYPPSIKNKVEKKSPQEIKLFKKLAIPMVLILFLFLNGTILYSYWNFEVSFIKIFFHYFFILFFFSIFDLFILDWLIFCTITPEYLIIPGTDKNSGYKNYTYHINGSLGKGLIILSIASLIFSITMYLFLKFFIWN
jgi:hypothetical protein